MAAQPARAGSKLSAKQLAADRANLAKARAAARAKPRTAKQIAAAKRNLAKARAVLAARRTAKKAGKQYVAPKAAKAAAPDTWTRYDVSPEEVRIHELPACAAVAAAEHLACWTGACVPAGSVLALHDLVRPARLADVLEYLAAEGFPGTGEKLARFGRCDPVTAVPGLLYGITLPYLGYHAVLARSGGMTSWGTVMPLAGEPEEAWWLEWEETG